MGLHRILPMKKIPKYIIGYKKVNKYTESQTLSAKPLKTLTVGLRIATNQDLDHIITGTIVDVKTEKVIIKRDDGYGHDCDGVYDTEDHWHVTNKNCFPIDTTYTKNTTYKTLKHDVNLGKIGTITQNPNTRHENYDPDYKHGFHVYKSMSRAKLHIHGNTIIKVKLSKIRVKGIERKGFCFVGDELKVLEECE